MKKQFLSNGSVRLDLHPQKFLMYLFNFLVLIITKQQENARSV